MYGYIYRITNLLNGMIYIGRHKSESYDKSYRGSGKVIKRVIKKHGWSNFLKEILCPCFSEEELNAEEEFLIEFFNARDPKIGYNRAKGGAGGSGPCSDEKRSKISKSLKESGKLAGSNNPMYGVHRYGEDSPHYGHKLSEESKELIRTKARMRPSKLKGRSLTESHRAKIRIAKLNCSDETRRKISEANKGRTRTEDQKKQMRDRMKGNNYASICKGMKRSEESKQRYSNVAKNRRWIHKDGVLKAVPSDELDFHLENGWKRGKIK